MVHTWIISFCMIFLVFNFSFASTFAARSHQLVPKKLTLEQWLKWVDRSKNSSAIRYYKKQKRFLKSQRKVKQLTKNENRNFKDIPKPPLTLERAQVKSDIPVQTSSAPSRNLADELAKQIQKEEPLAENEKGVVSSPMPLPHEKKNSHQPVEPQPPLIIEIAHEPVETQPLLPHETVAEQHSIDAEQHTIVLPPPLSPEICNNDHSVDPQEPLADEDKTEHHSVDSEIALSNEQDQEGLSEAVETDHAEQMTQPEKTDPLAPDLSTGFALSELEQLLKCASCGEEMGLLKKQSSFMKPHLVNGKGVYLSIYDDRQESLAPLSPIPFLKVSSQSTFNYIEDLGVIFIPINGTYLIKYGFSGDGMHWGEESSSVQLTINETTIIPNSTITSSQDGVMSSHSIILPLKVNDRVRLINSTPTNSLTLTQANSGGVTAYLEMILLK